MPDYKYDTTAYRQWSQNLQATNPMTRYLAGIQEFGGVAGYMEAQPMIYDPAYRWYNDAYFGLSDAMQARLATSPRTYPLSRDPVYALKGQIAAYQSLMQQFPGAESTMIRWLIERKITGLQNKLSHWINQRVSRVAGRRELLSEAQRIAAGNVRERAFELSDQDWWVESGETEPAFGEMVPGTRVTGGMGASATYTLNPADLAEAGRLERAAAEKAYAAEQMRDRTGRTGDRPLSDVPIPDWMRPYLQTVTPFTTGGARASSPRGTRVKGGLTGERPIAGTGQVKPLGAQAKLDPEQMQMLAGYLAWQKAGAPMSYSDAAIRAMADWQKWWGEYVAQSQKLMPKQVSLEQRWRPASQ